MKIEIEVTSRETIKPSSPTPNHLHHYQLSFLDQISPPVYNPLVLFYPSDQVNKNNIEKSNHLKQSISDVLTSFYPLSGRIKDNVYVDCNDEGAPYLEAQVKCSLSDVLENPVPSELNKLLPLQLDDVQELPLGVQFNIFQCGGVAIGVCISHKVADALSFLTFLKSWAETARGESDIVRPQFISATLFPPKNISGFEPSTGITNQNIVAKRFVFDVSAIETLRTKYTDHVNSTSVPPSRVEALTNFIWNRFVSATNIDEAATDTFYIVLHAVNLRPRMDPPLPNSAFGNLYRIAMTNPFMGACANLASQVRESISRIDKDYVKTQLQEGNEHLEMIKDTAESFNRGKMVALNFTSLCRFPLHEADFGWGRPVWVGSACLTFNNLVVFMDTVTGDGIEAWVHLKEEDMAKLEADEELIEFVVA
ncbi:stemmadenine O-acetyltransferase-like [Tripterygium wilfordii]|uniref:stemmadenine O-acetyltransferase-like n=1 Tax=Tripterygium wilfordii TaxID=458696 RepID=UPI0018F848AA|nr:stemmadenine O-acetyltransferase-like [Tripterygium wilfordii]